MDTYQAKRGIKVTVEAIQVARPYRKIKHHVPRSHRRDRPSGALDYIQLVDAPVGRHRARDGDWIVKHLDGTTEALPDEEFHRLYTPKPVGVPAADTADVDPTAAKSPTRKGGANAQRSD